MKDIKHALLILLLVLLAMLFFSTVDTYAQDTIKDVRIVTSEGQVDLTHTTFDLSEMETFPRPSKYSFIRWNKVKKILRNHYSKGWEISKLIKTEGKKNQVTTIGYRLIRDHEIKYYMVEGREYISNVGWLPLFRERIPNRIKLPFEIITY